MKGYGEGRHSVNIVPASQRSRLTNDLYIAINNAGVRAKGVHRDLADRDEISVELELTLDGVEYTLALAPKEA